MFQKSTNKGSSIMVSANDILVKNPVIAFFVLLLAFAANQFSVYNGNQKIEDLQANNDEKFEILSEELKSLEAEIVHLNGVINDLRYETPTQVIGKAFSGIVETTGLIELVQFWIDNDWSQKIVDLNKLCTQPERKIITEMIGRQPTIDVCRMVH